MNTRSRIGSLVSMMLLVVACSEDPRTPPAVSTGVDAKKVLGSLTADERKNLCDAAERAFIASATPAEFTEATCRAFAVGFAGLAMPASDKALQDACAQIYGMCVASPEKSTTTFRCDPIPASCKATVAEYEACLAQVGPFVAGELKAIPSCSMVTIAGLGTPPAEAPPPPACAALQQKCPGTIDVHTMTMK